MLLGLVLGVPGARGLEPGVPGARELALGVPEARELALGAVPQGLPGGVPFVGEVAFAEGAMQLD